MTILYNYENLQNIEEAKRYVIEEINPIFISYQKRGGPHLKLKKVLFEIINKFRPELLEQYKQSKKCNIKKHLMYCFLNDLNITPNTKYLIIDNNLNRVIIKNVSLYEFSYMCNLKSLNMLKPIIDYGIDLKYPRILYYSNEYIRKIINRMRAKYGKCAECGKTFRITHKSHKVCSMQCQGYLCSKRMKVKNPSQIYGISTAARKKQSITMKKKIKNGEWTPNITNSWANSKVSLYALNIDFRSTWEAYFYIVMKSRGYNLEYEKTRIEYYDSHNKTYRNYITDFTDSANRIIYEIKPRGLKESQNVKDKVKYALAWCSKHNYEFIFISNEWFKSNYDLTYLNDIEEEYKIKIERGIKQFEN